MDTVIEMIQMRLRLCVDERRDIIDRLMEVMGETSEMRSRLTNIIGEQYGEKARAHTLL